MPKEIVINTPPPPPPKGMNTEIEESATEPVETATEEGIKADAQV